MPRAYHSRPLLLHVVRKVALSSVLLACAVRSHAQDVPNAYGAQATVSEPAAAASERTLTSADLMGRARLRMPELLSAAPGLYVVQHAGGGKANQYFLRGFDADHGTDVALSVDGVPVNMVSHGHGQGYADLNWVIGELVQKIDVRKGPYAAEDGDFATAGALALRTYGHAPRSSLTLQGGRYGTYRGLAILAPELERAEATLAFEAYGSDGPFLREEDTERYNGFARIRLRKPGSVLALTATSYLGAWNASGQIPARAVQAGTLDRFGSVDRYEGGSTQRHSLYATYHAHGEEGESLDLLAYAVFYRFALYSDFTFFSADPVNGDMIRQRDERLTTGFTGKYQRVDRLGRVPLSTRFGISLRDDRIDNGLAPAPRRELGAPLVDARVGETSVGVFVESDVAWLPWLRSVVGARLDAFAFDVDDRLEDRSARGTRSSGVESAVRVSPKASVIVSPLEQLELYGNFGYGFHSNDARGVLRGVTPLTRALGVEAGARLRVRDKLEATLALFQLDLDSELVWVGDAGTTEPRGQTRRRGLEAGLILKPLAWLSAEANATFTSARYVNGPADARAVALAPTRIVSGTLAVDHPKGPFARLSVLHVGSRPATEDGFLTARGFTRLDAAAGYHTARYELALYVQNLLDTKWRESQFANVSRLRGEASPAACPTGTRPGGEAGSFAGCEDVHFTPGTPLSVIGSASIFF